MDTIFAQASARGKSGVAIIRVSGPRAFAACSLLAGDCPPLRLASLRKLRDSGGEVLDEALVLRFAAGASFTGEDVVEFHVHGGRGVTAAILDALSTIDGLRLAEPGEFTRRAFTNGCLDLSQVEGLADLIEAETEAQRRLAVRSLGGETSKKIERWRAWLLRAIALVEATIDFADEEVPEDVWPEVQDLLRRFEAEGRRDLRSGQMAQQVRDGFEVAIVGAPNVGKSTLLNALAGREAALTSEIAGTTRDVIEVRMEILGLLVVLLDTAGIREAEDAIEAAGVDLARNRATAADLRVFLTEDGQLPEGIPFQDSDIVALAKCDHGSGHENGVSGLTGHGVDWLLNEIGERLGARVEGASTLGHLRQREAVSRAVMAIGDALALIEREGEAEEISAELRIALRQLEAVIGRVDVEDVLGEIFSSFCIGK